MIGRTLIPLLVAAVLAASVVAMWWFLGRHESEHFALLTQAQARASRSELSRDLETQLRALRKVADFWGTYGHLEPSQWGKDARIELDHFEGIEIIVWNDPRRGIRYSTPPDDLTLDQRPSDAEWSSFETLLAGLSPADGEVMTQPEQDPEGHYTYRIQVPATDPQSQGMLVARIDAHDALQSLLRESSPGYAVAVQWDGRELYRRGEPAATVPPAWTDSGPVPLSMGPVWQVRHAPTAALAVSVSRPVVTAFLIAGCAIAVLAGFLIRQHARTRERAVAAESAESRLASLNAELEREVELRTRELAQRSTDLETISESVTHDMRNPLNTVALNVHLLQAAVDKQDLAMVTTATEHVERAKDQMAGILDRLRSFSRVSFAEFRREPIDMYALARNVFDELHQSEPAPEVDFTLGELPPCQADPKLVKILLWNLLGNALKFTRDRAARQIEMGFDPDSQPPAYYVRDNGDGFDPDRADELFRPFSRTSGARRGGQGVGLAVAARVVHRHGGWIRAEGRPGEGATFTFALAGEGGQGI